MIAQNFAPGLHRGFAGESWRFLPAGLFERARQEAQDSIERRPVAILGSDIDGRSIDLCKKHAKKAGIMVQWAVRDFRQYGKDAALFAYAGGQQGLMVCNPPYGERMGERKAAEAIYRQLGALAKEMDGWRQSIITSHRDFERFYGRKADNRRKLSNGGMPCTLYQFFRN